MLYYNQTIETSLKHLKSSVSGLSPREANKRLKEYGSNEITVKGEPLWRKIITPFADVFMLVLAIAGVISLLHGDTLDAVIIFVIMAVNAAVYYIQRFSTERVLRALRRHTAQDVEVIRDGKVSLIDSRRLVPGDIILLTEGDKIPADGRIISESNTRTDESMLTGESEPISKSIEPLAGSKEIYERTNTLFQGSFIVSGETTLLVTATGNATEFGQIAALSSRTNTKSPIQSKIDKLVRQIVAVMTGLSIAAFALAIYDGMELAESLSFVMALAVSAVPEGLPIAISVILVLGIRRMAARKALVRNMRAIETLGVLTTIATDKTGTLTKNKLAVHETWRPESVTKDVFNRSIRASAISGHGSSHDPLDVAIHDYTKKHGKSEKFDIVAALPFEQSVAMSGNILRQESKLTLNIKGAPEHVIANSDLTDNEREEATVTVQKLTAQGYRVIALASTDVSKVVESLTELPKNLKFDLTGLLAISDTLRPEAKKAIATARSAGVTVRMITGDHLETAYHIGRQLGIVQSRDQVFDSRKMSLMDEEDLEKAIASSLIFSRVTPEHKYRILTILKKHHITAMTGDGVNDVPALSNAHVGVTMGSGTEIAKDAGDIILLDDNFKSIVEAMREGRVIVSNISRMLFYLLSTNAGEVLTMIGALIIGIPLPLLPVQLLWINLVTDTSMVIPLGLEPGEDDVMKRKPKAPTSSILPRRMVIRMVLVALTMTAVTLSFYVWFASQHSVEYGRTVAFSALVVMQWANAFNARSDHQSIFSRIRVMNKSFYVGLFGSALLQALVIFGPLQQMLHIEQVSLGDLAFTGAVAFASIIIIDEIFKLFARQK